MNPATKKISRSCSITMAMASIGLVLRNNWRICEGLLVLEVLNNAGTLGFELCLWSFGMFFFTSITSTGMPSLLRNATSPGGGEKRRWMMGRE